MSHVARCWRRLRPSRYLIEHEISDVVAVGEAPVALMAETAQRRGRFSVHPRRRDGGPGMVVAGPAVVSECVEFIAT